MSFPRDSAFNRHQLAMDHAAGVVPTNVVPGPVRHVGRPNIVEVPLDTLEGWVQSLEVAANEGDVQDVLLGMRSYLRG